MTAPDTLDQKTTDTDHRRHLVNPMAQDTQTMRNSVEKAMNNYFAHLEGQEVTNVYDMVLSEMEAPLLETVMTYVNGNQTRAATILGLNRGTLRKKLKQYDLL